MHSHNLPFSDTNPTEILSPFCSMCLLFLPTRFSFINVPFLLRSVNIVGISSASLVISKWYLLIFANLLQGITSVVATTSQSSIRPNVYFLSRRSEDQSGRSTFTFFNNHHSLFSTFIAYLPKDLRLRTVARSLPQGSRTSLSTCDCEAEALEPAVGVFSKSSFGLAPLAITSRLLTLKKKTRHNYTKLKRQTCFLN